MKNKINIRFVGISILAILATTLCLTMGFYSSFQNQVRNDLRMSANLIKETQFFREVREKKEDIHLFEDMKDLRITWVDADGTVLYDNDLEAEKLVNHSNRPEIIQAIQNGSAECVRESDTMNMNTFYYAVLLDDGTVLRVAMEAQNIKSVFFVSLPILLLIICCICFACVVLSHILTKQLIKPIEQMAESMDNPSVKSPYKELQPFVEMIRRQHMDILSAARTRQDFTANVTHELKTPLTAISGYAELIANQMVDTEESIRFANEIRKNAERLLSLINDIIRLSELDQNEKRNLFEEVNLRSLAEETIENLKVMAQKHKVSMQLQALDEVVRGSRDMLLELMDNLVQNAIRYNSEGGHVWVTVSKEDGRSVLKVKDDGIGISKEEQGRIFERFYRVDKSRSKATGGTGLGLAIVKHIVEIHDAKIEIHSEEGKGCEICVVF